MAMESSDPFTRRVPPLLMPGSETASYLPWLKVSVALRYVRTSPWAPEAWREAQETVRRLLAQRSRPRNPGFGPQRPPIERRPIGISIQPVASCYENAQFDFAIAQPI